MYFCAESLNCKPLQYVSTFLSHFHAPLVQATELAATQQTLSTLQQRLAVSERHVEELEKQQEGKG